MTDLILKAMTPQTNVKTSIWNWTQISWRKAKTLTSLYRQEVEYWIKREILTTGDLLVGTQTRNLRSEFRKKWHQRNCTTRNNLKLLCFRRRERAQQRFLERALPKWLTHSQQLGLAGKLSKWWLNQKRAQNLAHCSNKSVVNNKKAITMKMINNCWRLASSLKHQMIKRKNQRTGLRVKNQKRSWIIISISWFMRVLREILPN